MWQYHDSKLKELKKTYNKVSKQTQNRLQEIFDSFNITFDTLDKPIRLFRRVGCILLRGNDF